MAAPLAGALALSVGAGFEARVARAEGSIADAARAIAHDLGASETPHGSVVVVASPLTSDVAAPRGDELAARVAQLVAGALGGDARAEARPMLLAAARARGHVGAATVGAIVYLDVRVDGGEVRLTADRYPVVANAWDRLRAAPPPPASHAYAHVRVTAEVRAYLAPVHLERAQLTKWKHDAGPVLAIACGDLDGAGGNDLVLVSQREVAWGYLRDGRFVAVRRAPAASLGPRAPVPWRDPLATASLVAAEGPATLYVGWSDRTGASTGPDLVARTHLSGLPVALGAGGAACVAPSPAQAGFEDTLVACDDGHPIPGGSTNVVNPMLVDTWIAFDLVDVEGHATHVVATRQPSGALRMSRPAKGGTTDTASMQDVGAQVALGDLDQDGLVEAVTTLGRSRGEEDALIVSTWDRGGLSPRLRFAAPAGVDAVAVCPAETGDVPSVVAAVGAEIWVVR